MPLVQKEFRILCPTGTGDLAIGADIGGVLATGIEIIAGHQTNLGSLNDQNKGSYGFADDSLNQHSISWQDEDGQGTTDTDCRHSDIHCLEIMNTGANTIDISARVQSGAFDTVDEVTINFDNVGSAVYIIGVIYGGVAIVVGTQETGTTVGVTKTVSTPGITPRFIKFGAIQSPTTYNNSSVHASVTWGAGCLHDGNYVQGAFGFVSRNAQGTSSCFGLVKYFNDSGNTLSRVLVAIGGDGSTNHQWELTRIASGEFDIVLRDNAPATTNRCMFMAFETDVDEVNIKAPLFNSGTGAYSFTGFGFEPAYMHFTGGLSQTLGTQRSSDPGTSSAHYNYWDGQTGNFTRGMGWWSNDNVATSDTKQRNETDRNFNVRYGNNSGALRASHLGPQSLDSDGFTVEIDILTNSVYLLAIAFKTATAGHARLLSNERNRLVYGG